MASGLMLVPSGDVSAGPSRVSVLLPPAIQGVRTPHGKRGPRAHRSPGAFFYPTDAREERRN